MQGTPLASCVILGKSFTSYVSLTSCDPGKITQPVSFTISKTRIIVPTHRVSQEFSEIICVKCLAHGALDKY